MRYTCATCGELHDGVPSLSAAAPLHYYAVPEAERAARCRLDGDDCVIDDRFFFVRGCLEVPILGQPEPFVWGVWVSLSERSFDRYRGLLDEPHRASEKPFFGWLSARLAGYPSTENLKTLVHLRDHGQRPSIELEPTEHPLAIEQRNGIMPARASEILSLYAHERSPA